MLARLTILAMAAAAWTTAALAQHGAPVALPPLALTPNAENAEVAARLDPWFRDLIQRGLFNGAVLVARDGQEIFTGTYGPIDVAGSAPITVDTRFPMASIGKAFTQVAIYRLIEAGQVSPDDTVGELLPDYPTELSRSATVRQLLTHRGGIADIFGPAFRDAPRERFARNHDYYTFVSTQPPMFAPDSQEEYCNGCYVVLGEIIERVSGQTYEDYVTEHVFARAGMTRSGFPRRDQPPPDTARFMGRPQGPDTPLVDVSDMHGLGGSAAGNAYSTLRDMLAFDNALREHRLIRAEHTAEVLRSQPESGRATARVGFAGGGPGVNTMMFGNGAVTLVVLANVSPPAAESVGVAVFPLLAGPRPQ